MRTKILLVLFALIIAMGNLTVSRAIGEDASISAITDVTLVRPGCFIATVIGSVVFVVALPIAAASGSVQQTAETLVMSPARATFTRPVGDFSDLE